MLQPGSVFNTDQKLYHLVQETSSVYRVVCPERSAVLIRVLCFYCIIFPNQVLKCVSHAHQLRNGTGPI